MEQWFSKCCLWTSSLSVTGRLFERQCLGSLLRPTESGLWKIGFSNSCLGQLFRRLWCPPMCEKHSHRMCLRIVPWDGLERRGTPLPALSLLHVYLPHFCVAPVKVRKNVWLPRRPQTAERLMLLVGTLAGVWNCPALGVLKPEGGSVCGTLLHTLPALRDESMAVKRWREFEDM